MKILYGVQGTGNGHISRCRTMAKAFKRNAIDVDFLFSGRAEDKYFDMSDFESYKIYKGMTFVAKNGKINIKKTAEEIRAFRLLSDLKHLDLSGYDCVVSDFEPITAWAAHNQKRKCIGISNQSINHYIHPKEYTLLAKMIMRYYAPCSLPVGLHWFHFGFPLVPPIIDDVKIKPDNENIVVYLPFESLKSIKDLLLPFSDEHPFVCYHPDVIDVEVQNSIHFQPLNTDNFTQSISGCSGIICNSGFAAISEALVLGKKILTKPVEGQFEQIYNSKCLDSLNMATTMKTLNHKTLEQWLQQLKPEPIIYPNVADALVEWIVDGEKRSLESLSNDLWRQTYFPDSISKKINALGFAV